MSDRMIEDPRRLDVSEMITPLRLIFWGALIRLIDIKFSHTTNGEGFKFDLLDDTVGSILIMVGVFRLSRIAPGESVAKGMAFVKIVGVLSTFRTVIDHFVFRAPDAWTALRTMFSIAEIGAVIVLCVAMVSLCRTYGLEMPEASWRTTTSLFVFLYAIPLGLIDIGSLAATTLGKSFNLDIGPAALLLLAVFLIPSIHFFVSTSRMARTAGRPPSA